MPFLCDLVCAYTCFATLNMSGNTLDYTAGAWPEQESIFSDFFSVTFKLIPRVVML